MKNKKLRNLLIAAVVLLGVTGIVVVVNPGLFMDFGMWLTSSAKHRNAAEEKPAFTLTAQQLSDDIKNDTAAFKKYVDKAVLVNGPISAIEGNHISLGNVICSVDSTEAVKISKLATGQEVKIQGRVSTYNDLMEEIVLDQCVIK